MGPTTIVFPSAKMAVVGDAVAKVEPSITTCPPTPSTYVSEAKFPVVKGVKVGDAVGPGIELVVGDGVRVIEFRVGTVATGFVGEVVRGKNTDGAGAPTVVGDSVLAAALSNPRCQNLTIYIVLHF